MRRAGRLGVLVVAVLVGGGLVACGDDDDDAEGNGGGEGASAEACDAYIGVTKAFNVDEPDPEAIGALLDDLDAAAPDAVADEIAVMTSTAREAIESGDFDAFEGEEFTEAQQVVDPFFFEDCDAEAKAEVTAVDYAFEGAPDEVRAGEVAFLFTNNGEELHEMVLLRKKDDTEQSFDEILELPEEEGQELVEGKGGMFGFPGSVRANWVDLEAGEYTMVCFIPVGSTPDAGEEGGDGPPHFVEGMRRDFEVT